MAGNHVPMKRLGGGRYICMYKNAEFRTVSFECWANNSWFESIDPWSINHGAFDMRWSIPSNPHETYSFSQKCASRGVGKFSSIVGENGDAASVLQLSVRPLLLSVSFRFVFRLVVPCFVSSLYALAIPAPVLFSQCLGKRILLKVCRTFT